MQYRWRDCRLDIASRTLERGGVVVRIQSRAFDLLALLLRHRGRLVSDAFLRGELWPGVSVGHASLRQVLKEARRAIGDDGRRQAQIETVRGRGLRFDPSGFLEGGADASFVGRDDVVATLEHDLDATEAGRGGVTLLSGRAGFGKTSTLLEIAARAEARGWRVFRAWARSGAESDSYSPWIEVADALGASALTEASRELPASEGISESNRFARFRAFEQALLRAVRERALLLCFDDLQFADRESLALLRFLAPALRSERARILGSHRPLAANDGRSRDLAALAADGATRIVELRGLRASELCALVSARLGAAVGADAADALAARTGGSPLLALEVVRALSAGTAPALDVSAQQIEASVELGLSSLLERRLAALAPSSRQLLRAASAIGDPFDPELARAATSGSREELERALAEAERSGLIERQRGQVWRFAHPLFAEAVANDLAASGAGEAARMHLRLFEALDAKPAADPFRVAKYVLGAGSLAEAAVAVDRLRRAARAASRVQASADAEIWQRAAVEIAEAAAWAPLELCDLLQELGEFCVAASGVLAARAFFDRAARIAQAHGDARRLARAVLAHAHRAFVLGSFEAVLGWLRVAHAAPCGDAALEARVAARLGGELAVASPASAAEVERLQREGIERARETRDALTLGYVLTDVGLARFSASDPRGALAMAREIESCGRHSGDIEIEFRGMAGAATASLELGDRAGVDDAQRTCESFVRRFPMPYARAVERGIAATLAMLDGRLTDAAIALDASEPDIRGMGSLGLTTVLGLQRFLLAREGGGLERILPALDQARTRFPNVLGLTLVAGLARSLVRSDSSAQEVADGVLARLDSLPLDRSRLPTLAISAELSYLARSRRLGEALEPQLAPFAELHAVLGNAAGYFGSVSHALGFATAAQGRRQAAIRHFERALRAHEAMRSPSWSRRSAEALAEIRRPGGGIIKLVS